MNIKREQVRECISCCQLVMVGDNQLTDLQRQADLLRRISEFRRSWDDTWLLLVSAGVTAEGEEGWQYVQAGRAWGSMSVVFLCKMLIARLREKKKRHHCIK